MLDKITSIVAYFVKNVGLIVGIFDAAVKVLAGIASLTPTEKDDAIVQWIEDHKISSNIQKVADFLEQFGK
jgi:hypothetical protein